MSRTIDRTAGAKLLGILEGLEAEMDALAGPIAEAFDRGDHETEEALAVDFRRLLDRYTALMDKMQASALWPDTVEELRVAVSQAARTELPGATSDYHPEAAHV